MFQGLFMLAIEGSGCFHGWNDTRRCLFFYWKWTSTVWVFAFLCKATRIKLLKAEVSTLFYHVTKFSYFVTAGAIDFTAHQNSSLLSWIWAQFVPTAFFTFKFHLPVFFSVIKIKLCDHHSFVHTNMQCSGTKGSLGAPHTEPRWGIHTPVVVLDLLLPAT